MPGPVPGPASLLAVGVGAIVSALRATLRIERVHFERVEALHARGTPVLYALWHGRMFLPIQSHNREGVVTMASRSKDGEIIALWLERNGWVVVRGSTTRGGMGALKGMVREVRSGRSSAMTVDGPKGPPRVVQPGVVQLARLTGGWIVPVGASSRRGRFMTSWDRYLVPYPFSWNVVVYGEPFPIPETMSDEEAARAIGAAVDAATAEADAIVGVAPSKSGAGTPGRDAEIGRE